METTPCDTAPFGCLSSGRGRRQPHFAPDRRRTAMIAAICRRLDGIPLAIELAAARAAVFGIEELAARLDDRFHLLTGGRRTALPRHQTLRATLDWSYELLTEPERVILRRLAVFAGAFSLEAASAVVASPEIAPSEVVDGLANLVAKSLVAAEVDGTRRALPPARHDAGLCARKARAKAARRERSRAATPNITGTCSSGPKPNWSRGRAAEWPADYGRRIDNLRAALDWAFSPDGDASIGVALTAAAVPLWMHLSLLDECRSRVERALAALAVGADRDPRREMKLQAALAGSLIYTGRLPMTELAAAWTKALEIAESLDDAEYRLLSLWGLWFFHGASSRHRIALELAERFLCLAANRPDPELSAGRRAHDRCLAALSRRPVRRAAPSRTGAR